MSYILYLLSAPVAMTPNENFFPTFQIPGTDSETMLRDSFKLFDEENTGIMCEE